MNRSDTRLVFMGTPEFAVSSLESLIDAGYTVAAVVTQPDRPRGRGHRVSASPVKVCAEKYGIPVIQMDKISSPAGVATISELTPDYLITAAFGQILSQSLLDVPRVGTINVHASLLPKYRGASPIVRALMNGEKRTGITTMMTVRELDAGPILMQEAIDIGDVENAGELTRRLADLGGKLLVRTLDGLNEGTVSSTEQNASLASYYPMFTRGYDEIDWNRTVDDIVNFVRAMSPLPGAFFMLGDEKVRVLSASRSDSLATEDPGTVVCADPRRGLHVTATDGVVSLDEIRRSGRKAMSARDSLRGNNIDAGTSLCRRGD